MIRIASIQNFYVIVSLVVFSIVFFVALLAAAPLHKVPVFVVGGVTLLVVVTDAVVLELLLASSYSGSQCEPAVLTLEARRMVDERADVDLLAAMEAKSVDCTGCSWSGSSEAKRAARALINVAIKCVKAVQARSTPADVLPELEALGALGARRQPLSGFSTS